ncbi:MAG: hypothetical protein JWR01_266 [Subtercola sp.]|nr:hypothetical protein [Subtercola sp.]
MVDSRDITLPDGRTLRVHVGGDSGDNLGRAHDGAPVILWHHGSPQTGALLRPLLDAAAERGVRLVSFGRPGYGGSSPLPGRTVASVAADVRALADALGLARFALMGSSGGNPHVLACAALLPGRVSAAVCFSSLAPFDAAGLDWFDGMVDDGGLRSAVRGPAERELYEQTAEFDADSFVSADYKTLEGPWSAMGDDVEASAAWGNGGVVADDLAFVTDWGFDVSDITAPILLVQGQDDRITPFAHAEWLQRQIAGSELWPDEHGGHVSVHDRVPAGMDWLLAHS